MRKVAIVTIQSINYGNRLQNYALSKYLSRYCKCETLYTGEGRNSYLGKTKQKIRALRKKNKIDYFCKFDLNIPYSKYVVNSENNEELVNSYDYFITGSDQVWNPLFNFIGDREFLTFAKPEQRVAYAASIGISQLPQEYVESYRKRLSYFKAISVREDSGAKIIENLIGQEVPVLLDPTMLLDKEDWISVSEKSKYQPKNKYIFKYILGNKNEKYNQWIDKIAKKNQWEIFELNDVDQGDNKAVGPAEFIDLIKNSELVCTDSFHGTVFSILFQKKFITFERAVQEGFGKMSSRLDTLLKLFNMEKYRITTVNDIDNFDFEYNFENVSNILMKERKKSEMFIKKALEIE